MLSHPTRDGLEQAGDMYERGRSAMVRHQKFEGKKEIVQIIIVQTDAPTIHKW